MSPAIRLPRERLLVIGNGMAAAKLCEELDSAAHGRFDVTVVGAEPHLAYNRVLLSCLLAGEIGAPDIELHSAAWWRAKGVTVRTGCPVAAIDIEARHAVLADGTVLGWDRAGARHRLAGRSACRCRAWSFPAS